MKRKGCQALRKKIGSARGRVQRGKALAKYMKCRKHRKH